MDAAIIEKEALLLPDAERAILADRLISSLETTPQEIRESWLLEANDRMAAFESCEIAAVDGPEAIAQLKARFAK